MDLNDIVVFTKVVETRSFTGAAEQLGLPKSTVSRKLAQLEERLGVRLFQRTPRGVEITDEARRLHADVAPLLGDLGEATQRAARSTTSVRGLLRVNADAPLGEKLATHLATLLERHPELEIDLTVRTRLADAEASGFDVAVRFGPPERSSLTCKKLLETRVFTCAAPSYLLRHGRPTHPRELEQHELLRYRDPATGKIFAWELRRGHEVFAVESQGRLVLDDPTAALRACVAGYGIFQPLEGLVRPYLHRGELEQLLPDWSDERWPAYAYYRGTPNARVRVFLDFVAEITRQASAPPPSTATIAPETKPLRTRKR